MLQLSREGTLQSRMPQPGSGKRTKAISMDREEVWKSRSKGLTHESSSTTPLICTLRDARRGMYVPVTIGKLHVHLLIDTGAMVTILSNSLYKQIQRTNQLSPTNIRLKQADGAEVTVYGTVFLTMKIGLSQLQTSLVVADIQNDGILGMDVLLRTGSVIHCDRFEVLLNGETIRCADAASETLMSRCVNHTSAIEHQVPNFLHQLLEKSKENTNISDYPKIEKLLSDYQDVFSQGDHDIGRTDKVTHGIHTTCPAPIRQRPRRSPIGQREEVEKQIQDMLDRGIIKPSASPWSSPVVLVSKKDGSKRFCVDYRALNKHTVKDSFPLPRIDESLDYLAGAKYFCTLDLAAGYWQVPLDEDAKLKSAFVVPGGLFQFEVMPFGLCNAPSTFERLMEAIFRGLQWKTLLIYLDDVIVFGSTVEEVIERLEAVLVRLRDAKLKLKPKKCHLFQTEVLYLGHVVSSNGISTDPAKTDSVRNWPTPTNPTDIRSFLGLASYYRRFVKKFSDVVKPLTALTQKNQPFVWTPECETAFQTMKERLTTSPILAYPQIGVPFVLDTDASNYGIGAVLSQEKEGKEVVVAYASRTLSKVEQNYCVTRRELLAIVVFLKHFRHYLYGHDVLVRTDHGALRWLMNFKNPEGQVARWLEVISQYRLTLEHRPGRVHSNADGLSRRPCSQCGRLDDLCNNKQ